MPDNKLNKLPSVDKLRCMFSYSEGTGELTRLITTSPRAIKGSVVGGAPMKGYLRVNIGASRYLLHRVIWKMKTGVEPPTHIDHLNHQRNDNRWENIRSSGSLENNKNMSIPSDNKSGFIGVFWDERKHKWKSYINCDGARNNLGSFDCKIDAIAARIRQAKKLGFHENHGVGVSAYA